MTHPAWTYDVVKALQDAIAELAKLRRQIHDAEMSLNVYDPGHDSEYWLRYEQHGDDK